MAQAEGAAAIVGLEPPHPDGSLKNGRRGVARVHVRVGGRESHAGLDPKKGVSAVDELVDQLLALRQTMPTTGDAGYNVGAIKGGTRANVVAGSAEAEIGLRFWATSTEQAMYKALSSLAPVRDGATVEWDVLSQRPAWPVGENASLVNHVLAVAARLGDQFQARPADGAGDTNITGALGIPTVDGLGPRGRGAHAYGEAVEMASILDRAALLAALMTIGLPT